MASAIDPAKPITGTPTTQSVRDNFQHAKDEIEALQVAIDLLPDEYLPVTGGRVDGTILIGLPGSGGTGSLRYYVDPTDLFVVAGSGGSLSFLGGFSPVTQLGTDPAFGFDSADLRITTGYTTGGASGDINIETGYGGVSPDGVNSGNITLRTAAATGGGTRGTITLDGQTVFGGRQFSVGAPTLNATPLLRIAALAGQSRQISFDTGSQSRWLMMVDSVVEAGSNAGSDWALWRFNDAGASIGQAIGISRSTGVVTIGTATQNGIIFTPGTNAGASAKITTTLTPTAIDFPNGGVRVSFGAAASVTDFTKHLDMSGGFGIGWTANRMNIGANGSNSIVFVCNALDVFTAQNNAGTVSLTDGYNTAVGLFHFLNAAAATNRRIAFRSAGSTRWDILVDNVAEGGSNAGSNLSVTRYADNGSAIDVPIGIVRSTGIVALSQGLAFTTAAGPTVRSGAGAASGTQPSGSLWIRTDGAAGSRIYVSQGGGTWVPIATV